jgi:hypothetical protein
MITITEALSEINLIKKKLVSKRGVVSQMLIRAEHIPDTYEKEGGSRAYIDREVQSINDLCLRLISIRAGINRANLKETITISENGHAISQSIHDWLIWKREIINDDLNFYKTVTHAVKMHLDSVSKQPQVYKDDAGNIHLVKSMINIDYPAWQAAHARASAILEKLDGQLSLKNATILIDV